MRVVCILQYICIYYYLKLCVYKRYRRCDLLRCEVQSRFYLLKVSRICVPSGLTGVAALSSASGVVSSSSSSSSSSTSPS